MKYKIPFNGFVLLEADSPEEALEMAQNDNAAFEEKEFESACEIKDFVLR